MTLGGQPLRRVPLAQGRPQLKVRSGDPSRDDSPGAEPPGSGVGRQRSSSPSHLWGPCLGSSRAVGKAHSLSRPQFLHSSNGRRDSPQYAYYRVAANSKKA